MVVRKTDRGSGGCGRIYVVRVNSVVNEWIIPYCSSSWCQ